LAIIGGEVPSAQVTSQTPPAQATVHTPVQVTWQVAAVPQLTDALLPAVMLQTVLLPLHAALPLSPVAKVQVAPSRHEVAQFAPHEPEQCDGPEQAKMHCAPVQPESVHVQSIPDGHKQLLPVGQVHRPLAHSPAPQPTSSSARRIPPRIFMRESYQKTSSENCDLDSDLAN
jgi:hypothetical protein